MLKTYSLCIGLLLFLNTISFHELSLQPNQNLHLHMFDVGQGDGILLVSPSGKQIVIDGGPNTDLLSALGTQMPFFDRTIELLVLSHPDSDHITALPDILKRYKIGAILLNGTQHNTGKYEELLHLIHTKNIPVILADTNTLINIGDGLKLEVIYPSQEVFGTKPKHPNNKSVVLRAHYGEQKILLTGDIEEKTEVKILQSGRDVSANILKVPHHGSRTSSSTGFLLAIEPKLALLSAGRNNKFGHPHEEVVKRYDWMGVEVLNTQKLGTISLECNKNNCIFTNENIKTKSQ